MTRVKKEKVVTANFVYSAVEKSVVKCRRTMPTHVIAEYYILNLGSVSYQSRRVCLV
jgi:hypothetical protein